MSKIIVIGAGAMGLAAGYYAAKNGHDVIVLEADDRIGGAVAHFDFDGLSIERFYHFICKADQHTFDLLDELGLNEKMMWRNTSMGYYTNKTLYPFGDPISLLLFPGLDLLSKVRYGLQMFFNTKRSNWKPLDSIDAVSWIKQGSGEKAYALLWKRLFELKFFEYTDNISAAWIWSRIKRVGNSRKSIFQEELGHIDGGSEILLARLKDKLEEMGGQVTLDSPVSKVAIENGSVSGVWVKNNFHAADKVISTIPIPLILKVMPDLPGDLLEKYKKITNIPVVCVIHKLSKSVSRYFWLNIVDNEIDIPGIIEFSHLRPLPETIVYIPYYLPASHPKYSESNEFFIEESFQYIKKINPDIGDEDRLGSRVARLPYAQPICTPNFLDDLPAIQTPIDGLQIADTCYYYPEDRGMSESMRFAKIMVDSL